MSILDRGYTLQTLARYVDGLEKRIAALEDVAPSGPMIESAEELEKQLHQAGVGREVINRGRWWYVVNDHGASLNSPGFATREEAEALLASMSEAEAKAA